MNVLKFRAKLADGKIIYSDDFMALSVFFERVSAEGLLVDQFINKKDKNGTDIYTGDKLAFRNSNMDESEILGYIIYDDLRCCYSVSSEVRKDYYGIPLHNECDEGVCESKQLEIIGNIYKESKC